MNWPLFNFSGKVPLPGSVKLIVGLGNPGREYENTRHNIGILVAGKIAEEIQTVFKKRTSYAEWAEQSVGFGTLVLAKPRTFMNRSGLAVKKLMASYRIRDKKDILVVVDDADLPFGKIRFREKGSSGGHRGLDSIIAELGDSVFPRLRIGIGRSEGKDLQTHVLEPFASEESDQLNGVLSLGAEAAMAWAEKGCREMMNRYN